MWPTQSRFGYGYYKPHRPMMPMNTQIEGGFVFPDSEPGMGGAGSQSTDVPSNVNYIFGNIYLFLFVCLFLFFEISVFSSKINI